MARNIKNIFNLIDCANNEISIEQQFLNDLEYSIKKDDEQNEYIPSKTYKPSSLKCIRNAYFQIIGETPNKSNTTASLVGICESGTDRHLRIQRAITNMRINNIDCEYINVADFIYQRNLTDDIEIIEQKEMETKLYNKKLNMSFLCDGIVKYKSKYFILEIKTESSYKFNNRKSVAEEHYDQATAYSINFGLNDVLFVYECRDVCLKKAFILHITDEMKQDLLNRIDNCNNCIKEGKPPAKSINIDKKVCQYCNYQTICQKYLY